MAKVWERFKYKFVFTVGTTCRVPASAGLRSKFARRTSASNKDVKFYASLGNHDAREQRYYTLNMDGQALLLVQAPDDDVGSSRLTAV